VVKQLLRLAWRSIWRNKRRTIITLSSITFALALAVFFVAFGDGMYVRLIDDAVRMQAGQLTIENPDYREAPAIDLLIDNVEELGVEVESLPGVERSKALVVGQGVAKSGNGAIGVAIMGVQPSVEAKSSPFARKIIAGSYLKDHDLRKVVVGSQLVRRLKLGKIKEARRIMAPFSPLFEAWKVDTEKIIRRVQIHLAVGKKLVISSNNVDGELVDELVRVKGVFHTGSPEVDGFFVQLPLRFSRKLYKLGPHQATQLGILIKDPDQQNSLLEQLRKNMQPRGVAVLPWEKVLPDLATYIQVDKGSNIIFQGIFIFLILFVIFNTILMSVLERKREFAVLLAIGTPPGKIKIQILLESALLGFMGVALGLSIGALLSCWLAIDGLDLSQMMDESATISGIAVDSILRPKVTTKLLVVTGVLVYAAILLISLYPMKRIDKIHVASVLR
jgi:ABC-type lipoprotein release transport system permease subunit